jgi:NAD(P)-dependent dehydrogenase (short-subunit alcohol dehydrogenase family)
MDATNADQLIAAVAKAEAELGLVTILVNNAGIPDAQRAHKMSTELIDRVLDVNVRAPFILACEVARRCSTPSSPAGSSTSPRRRPMTIPAAGRRSIR